MSMNLVLPTVIEAISNPFDVMQGNSFGGHVPACKCHKLSNAITSQYRNSEYGKFKITHLKKMYLFVCLSGRLPRRKESGCPIRDSASRPGVGVGNTPYQVLPSVSEHAWVRTNIPNS